MQFIISYIIIVNLSTFIMYGVDKQKAVKGEWRISEKTLLGAAMLGGSLGAMFAMQLFRHKTKHLQFRIIIPLSLIVHVGLMIALLYITYIK